MTKLGRPQLEPDRYTVTRSISWSTDNLEKLQNIAEMAKRAKVTGVNRSMLLNRLVEMIPEHKLVRYLKLSEAG